MIDVSRGRSSPHGTCSTLRCTFPSSRRSWRDRLTGPQAASAADRGAAPVEGGISLQCLAAHRHGLLQEDRGRRQPQGDRGPGLQPEPAERVPAAGRGAGISPLQILADFSAYTDLARGFALLLGFETSENFRQPYLSLDAHRFLEPLAHHALHLAARLYLLPDPPRIDARRTAPAGLAAPIHPAAGDHVHQRTVARRGLDLRGLGSVLRRAHSLYQLAGIRGDLETRFLRGAEGWPGW